MTDRLMPMAVTGFSLRTSLGDQVETIAERMLAGDRAITQNVRFDARTYPCQVASTISSDPKPSKHRKFVKRMGLFGMEVGAEAYTKSQSSARGSRLGLFCGYGGLRAHWDDLMPVLENQDGSVEARESWTRGFSGLHPFWMLFHLSNNAHALLSIQLGATGDGTTTAGSNAGAQALCAASVALEMGTIDAAIVFSYDSLVEPETILSLGVSGAATKEIDASLIGAPYGDDANGFVPSEAAAAIVLEKPDRAADRALALVSATATADGHEGFVDPNTLGQALRRLARNETIVDGAGLAQRTRDDDERAILANIVSAESALLATTSSLGQMGAATSVVQTIMLMHFLSRRTLPPIAGLSKPTAGPLRPLVQSESTSARSAIALSCGMPGLVGAIRVELP